MNRGFFQLAIRILIGSLLHVGFCLADEPTATPAMFESRLKKHDELVRQLRPLLTGANPLQAVETEEKLVEVERELIADLEADSPDHKDQVRRLQHVVLVRLDWLADAYTQQEKFEPAIARRTSAARLSEEIFGTDHWETRRAKAAIAQTQAVSRLNAEQRKQLAVAKQLEQQTQAKLNKSPADAIRPWEQIAAVRAGVLGEKDSSFGFAEEQLGLCCMVQGDLAKSEQAYRHATEAYRAAWGKDDPAYAYALANLGDVVCRNGNAGKAHELLIDALDVLKRVYGTDDMRTRYAAWNLAETAIAIGHSEEARVLLASIVELERKDSKGNPERLAIQLQILGVTYMNLLDYGKAEGVFAEAAEVYHKAGEPFPQFAVALSQLSLARQALGDGKGALEAAKHAAEFIQKNRGENSVESAAALVDVADSENSLGKTFEALKTLHNAEVIFENAKKTDSAEYAKLLQDIGQFQGQIGHLREAKAAFDKAVDVLNRKFGEADSRTLMAMHRYATNLQGLDDYAAAAQLEEQVAARRRTVLGEQHPEYADSLETLAICYAHLANPRRGEPLLRQALELRKQQNGPKSIRYAMTVETLGAYYSAVHDTAEATRKFTEAATIFEQTLGKTSEPFIRCQRQLGGMRLQDRDSDGAEPLLRTVLKLEAAKSGENSPQYADDLIHLGTCLKTKAKFADAAQPIEQGRAILLALYGPDHRDSIAAQVKLGQVRFSMTDLPAARELLADAAERQRRILGPRHPELAETLTDLSGVYLTSGDGRRAVDAAAEAVGIFAALPDQANPYYAIALSNLGKAYSAEGDFSRAEPLLKKAGTILSVFHDEHRNDYAATLESLGFLYYSIGDFDHAKDDFAEAARVARELGESNFFYFHMQTALALAYAQQDDYDDATTLIEKAIPGMRAALGEQTLFEALNRVLLGSLRQKKKDYTKARQDFEAAQAIIARSGGPDYPYRSMVLAMLGNLDRASGAPPADATRDLEQSRALVEHAVGRQHPAYADRLVDIAALEFSAGDHAAAARLYAEALAIRRDFLDRTFFALSERQQLGLTHSVRGNLNMCLSLAADSSAREAYENVLQWKGASFRSQRAIRAAAGDPAAAALVRELRANAGELATLAVGGDATAAGVKQRLQQLAARHEEIELQLAHSSADFARIRQRNRVRADDVRKTLPAGTVLVDFIEYMHSKPGATPAADWIRESRLAAFVVSSDQEVRRIEFGSSARIYERLRRWRQSFHDADLRELKRLLYDPLAKDIQGAKLLLISPDDELARFPWGALPMGDADQVLLDVMPIAVVTAPALIPEMVHSNATHDVATDDSLLVVGDIDYNAIVAPSKPPGESSANGAISAKSRPHYSAMPSGGLPRFPPLPGTEEEIAEIARAWPGDKGPKSLVKLSGAAATADRFCQAAPSAAFVHLATHGYFAPASLRSAVGRFKSESLAPALLLEHGDLFGLDVVGHHPGVLSGLALAGANRFGRSDGDVQVGADPSNRILSALEVEGLDLPRTRLVVLSACETGLGETAHGEGAFSLQRAFHVAGAQTVVSSLWPVPDRATALLMERFYRNLWQEKMPRLAALREAQHWLRQEAARNAELLRGMTFLNDEEIAKDKSRRIPPRIWAGFILSGDWR